VDSKSSWIERQQTRGAAIIGVELDEDSISLAELRPAKRKSIVLLGHERTGLPRDVWPFLDQVVEIPMMGVGSSCMSQSPARWFSTSWPDWHDVRCRTRALQGRECIGPLPWPGVDAFSARPSMPWVISEAGWWWLPASRLVLVCSSPPDRLRLSRNRSSILNRSKLRLHARSSCRAPRSSRCRSYDHKASICRSPARAASRAPWCPRRPP
jgi:hypothetical protein